MSKKMTIALALSTLAFAACTPTPPADTTTDTTAGEDAMVQEEVTTAEGDTMMAGEGMEGVMMKDGAMMTVWEGGATAVMEKDVMMADGTKVMMDGKVMMSDGTEKMMKDGDAMTMGGEMMSADKMMKLEAEEGAMMEAQ